jgi:alpha-D-xyloside xylohydrolase
MPWEFESGGKPLYDEESLGWYREYSRLHLRLWPYEWTYVKRIPVDGRPIERPIGLVWPGLGVHPEDEYLLGEHLLVAPVMKRGLTGRDVYLPPGRWIDWFDDVVHEGGKTVAVDAPLSKAPLFLAQGGIVPLLRPTIDTLAPVKDPLAVDSYATTAGVIHAVTLPGAKSTFTLFDGSSLSQERTGDGLVLRYADGGEFRLGALFEARDVGTDPTQVTIDGAAAAELDSLAAVSASNGGWWRDSAKRRLHVKVGPGTHEVVAKVAW